MKTTLEEISSVKKRLLVEIEAEEIDKKINDAYRDVGKSAKIRGFRPGKVPRKILENYYGPQIIEDVTNNLVKETLPKALEETKIYPLNMPMIENELLKTGHDYKYSALMEVRPEFELKDYKGIEGKKEICSVTDEDVAKQLEEIREASGTLDPVKDDRGITDGDFVMIDYEAFENGNAIEAVSGKDFSFRIGKKQFYQEVENALIRMKKDEEKNIDVVFPEDHFHSQLAGKDIEFKVKIKDIKVIKIPDLTDEFANKLGEEFKSLDILKGRIKEDLTKREDERIEKELKDRLVKSIADEVDFELPECLVENEISIALENVRQNLKRSGSTIEESGIDEEKIKERFRPVSEENVKKMLILSEIANRENLTVGAEDESEGFEKQAVILGQGVDVIRSYYEANNLMDSFRESLLKEKTLNYIVEHANISLVPAEEIHEG